MEGLQIFYEVEGGGVRGYSRLEGGDLTRLKLADPKKLRPENNGRILQREFIPRGRGKERPSFRC